VKLSALYLEAVGTPTYTVEHDTSGHYFKDIDDDKLRKVKIRRVLLTINVPHNTGHASFAFLKSSNSRFYMDSREPKRQCVGSEVHAELIRILGQEVGDRAFNELNGNQPMTTARWGWDKSPPQFSDDAEIN
jgi:hypothetical protein